jgi:CDP-diacylglycerol--glycerol-3-phosphate 3-phosphatidyltransferase
MKIPYKFKKVFPNVLTGFRLGIAPIIIILGLMGKVNIVLLLTILSCLTDLFDGYFARKWDVSSQFGAKLDAISDKVFAISLLISLTKNIKSLWILITLEVSIALINLYFYSKTHKSETLLIGKMKTTSLFICIVISFFYLFFHKLHFLLNGFIYMTLNLQILAGSSYIIHFIKKAKEKEENTLENVKAHKQIMEEETV